MFLTTCYGIGCMAIKVRCVISNFGFQVIQRKLVHVVTPSTACDGNIGPDAVHLLSVKEVCMRFY